MRRMTRSEYFMQIAVLASKRGTCSRLNVGCVIVKDRRIISTGYNGSPPGLPHCEERGCIVLPGKHKHCRRSVHAEWNAIISASMNGVSPVDSTVYITAQPCYECLKILASCKVRKIIFLKEYRPDRELAHYYRNLQQHCGIQMVKYKRSRREEEEDTNENS